MKIRTIFIASVGGNLGNFTCFKTQLFTDIRFEWVKSKCNTTFIWGIKIFKISWSF